MDPHAWQRLPLASNIDAIKSAARAFWDVPEAASVVVAPGTSALIARIPAVLQGRQVAIAEPTYNEHRRAFENCGWEVSETAKTRVVVHPNNPDGRLWHLREISEDAAWVIDESFCDTLPESSLVETAARPGTIILKSMGKFWGLAGLRLGFAICLPETAIKLEHALGPWAVSGPALQIGTRALEDVTWAAQTRARLERDAARLDRMLAQSGLTVVGGTSLFRLAEGQKARALHEALAHSRIWTRVFPYRADWLRLGIPGPADDWQRLANALEDAQ